MPIKLSPADDARREERITETVLDKQAAIQQKAGVISAIDKELEKDAINTTYQNYFGSIIQSYEDEVKSLNGQSLAINLPPTTAWGQSLVDQVTRQAAEMTGPLYRIRLNKPLRMPALYAVHPPVEYCDYTVVGGAANTFESSIDPWQNDALLYLKNGFNYGPITTNLGAPLGVGDGAIDIQFATSFMSGDIIVIQHASLSAIAVLTDNGYDGINTAEKIFTFSWVSTLSGATFAPAGDFPYGSTVTQVLPAFTDSERTSVTSSLYQNILTNAKIGWVNYITGVRNFIQTQKATFDANQHDKKDAAYGMSLDNRLSQFNLYLSTSLVTDAAISSLQTNTLTPRFSERNARESSIPAILVSFYDKRYTFSNLRANTSQGSYAMYLTYSKGVDAFQGLIDFATAASTAYET
jgi:hypothetical protein